MRKVCPDCKEPVEPAIARAERAWPGDAANKGKFFVGKGCDKCFQTGYRGRTGIYEMMMISQDIQNLNLRKRIGRDDKETCPEHRIADFENGWRQESACGNNDNR